MGLLAAAPWQGLTLSQKYYLGLAILLVLLVIALVKAFRIWEEIHDVEEPDSPEDLLKSFESAHAAGELDDREFELVRQRLANPAAGLIEKPGPARTAAHEPGDGPVDDSA